MKKNITRVLTAASVTAMALTAVAPAAYAEDFKVGICQLVQHPALDAATKGFREELQSKLEADGDTVEFDEQNAAGDSATCATIVNTFVQDQDNLIMANATPALQAAQAATGDIPILGTSVTDYGTALDISDTSFSRMRRTSASFTARQRLTPSTRRIPSLLTWKMKGTQYPPIHLPTRMIFRISLPQHSPRMTRSISRPITRQHPTPESSRRSLLTRRSLLSAARKVSRQDAESLPSPSAMKSSGRRPATWLTRS